MKRLDLAGKTFGRLTVVSYSSCGPTGDAIWDCACACGRFCKIRGTRLRRGETQSCGCFQRHRASATSLTHGATVGRKQSAEYRTWCHMIARCENPRFEHFNRYGGRGISVCSRWRNDFSKFLADMGEKPSPRHTIERVDNDGNYSPENCVWAPRERQINNRECTVKLSAFGCTKPLGVWPQEVGIPRERLYQRIFREGWGAERALSTPVRAITFRRVA